MKYTEKIIVTKLSAMGIEPQTIDDIAPPEAYDDYLDDLYDEAGAPFGLNGSNVLRSTDPIAYRCGLNDWQDMAASDSGEWRELDTDAWYLVDDIDRATDELDSEA